MNLTDTQRENVVKWVAALRGQGRRKYRQTRGRLSSPDKRAMCCLGVACDVVAPDLWDEPHTEPAFSDKAYRPHDDWAGTPSQRVRELLGLECHAAHNFSIVSSR